MGELPQLLDPPHGYVQNANNPPWFTSLRDPIDPARFPSYVERGPLGLRPQVVLEALDGDRRFSPDDVRELKFTTRLLLAERVLPDLLAAARRVETPTPELASGIEVLSSWDRRVAGRRAWGAVLFGEFWEQLTAAKPQPFARDWDAARPASTPAGPRRSRRGASRPGGRRAPRARALRVGARGLGRASTATASATSTCPATGAPGRSASTA